MIFDLFHSFSDPVVQGRRLGAQASLKQFLRQAKLAEELGMNTLWLAESHFSSETQKTTSVGTIPEFHGEVGLNCDSFQLFHLLTRETKRIALGTGIHNIVGGSGGPIASAERVGFLHFLNQNFLGGRDLKFGIAAGRFPYQNTPFGIVPRNEMETANWNEIKGLIFLEALEIFLRLVNGEALSSDDLSRYQTKTGLPVTPRWAFEKLKLIPEQTDWKGLQIVLGSHDPRAFELGSRFWDLDLFNLSFTAPEQIEKTHAHLQDLSKSRGRTWHRARMPRTVMVFIDPSREKAQALANSVLDTYIEAMRGTAQVPDKSVLLSRALVGDATEIREQLAPGASRGFHPEDRLMLWFEFNQLSGEDIERQMKYFMREVAEKI